MLARGSGPSDLEAHLGYWLRRFSNQVSGTFIRTLRDQGVSAAEWVVARTLYGEDEVRPSRLADALGMTRGAISKVLDKLQERKWVTSSVSIEDQRVQLLSLTAQGRRIVPKLAAIADRNDEHFFGCLSDGEKAELLVLMRKLTSVHNIRNVPVD